MCPDIDNQVGDHPIQDDLVESPDFLLDIIGTRVPSHGIHGSHDLDQFLIRLSVNHHIELHLDDAAHLGVEVLDIPFAEKGPN
jgi:hypothetical protein